MNAKYATLLALFLACLLLRTTYEMLKKSGSVNPGNKSIFALVFTAMCLLWASWFTMCPMDPYPIVLPDAIRWTCLSIVILGVGLAIVALMQLRGLENIGHLVTTGVFSKIRHPMYTGFLSWIVGWSLYHGALMSLIAGFVGIGSILYWRRVEEDALELRYGDRYSVYRNHTWF